jgi:hypothetical protein
MTWLVVGAALDAAALMIMWLLLGAIGPLQNAAEYWLDLLALIAVPWFVHVVALPAVLRVTWIGRDHLLARTAGFVALAAMLIPIVGISAFFFIGVPVGLIFSSMEERTLWPGPALPIDTAIFDGVWTVVAAVAGAVMGFLLHVFRPGSTMDNLPSPCPRHPRMRSDVLGGAAAAFLAFGGVFLASPFGLFLRSVGISAVPMYSRAIAPQLPATITIGVVALLPHLFMVGRDLFFGADLRQEEV